MFLFQSTKYCEWGKKENSRINQIFKFNPKEELGRMR